MCRYFANFSFNILMTCRCIHVLVFGCVSMLCFKRLVALRHDLYAITLSYMMLRLCAVKFTFALRNWIRSVDSTNSKSCNILCCRCFGCLWHLTVASTLDYKLLCRYAYPYINCITPYNHHCIRHFICCWNTQTDIEHITYDFCVRFLLYAFQWRLWGLLHLGLIPLDLPLCTLSLTLKFHC